MRFIHTADWHIGRSFSNISLIDDQAYVLDQLVNLARETKPDAFIVAGDIYDRAVPPTEAVKLLDDVLWRLIFDVKVPVILIAGNHDSPLRLEFAARLMESHRLYVFGSLSERMQTAIDLFDEWGRVSFYPVPYAEPSQMSTHLGQENATSHEIAVQQWTDFIKGKHVAENRSVLIHHAFVAGGEESESERSLDVGGTGAVPASCYDGFNYVALGHLHRPQCLGEAKNIHYSGSLLKYSFSETTHTKCAKLVDMDSMGICKVESIPLIPKHDVRRIEGTMDDLLNSRIELGKRDDYVQVSLLDQGAVFDASGRLRDVFPNFIGIDRAGLMNPSAKIERPDHRQRDVAGLFKEFYQFVTNEALTEEQGKVLARIANKVRQSERDE